MENWYNAKKDGHIHHVRAPFEQSLHAVSTGYIRNMILADGLQGYLGQGWMDRHTPYN